MRRTAALLALGFFASPMHVEASTSDFGRAQALVRDRRGCRDLERKEVAAALGARTPRRFESARACALAEGRAISVVVVTECGGDTCASEGWLFTHDRTFAIPSETDFDVSRDAKYFFYTRVRPTKVLGEYEVDLARRVLATGVDTSLARCASPTVSPGSAWILCRSPKDDVMRVPAGGGALERVAKGGSVTTSWTPYARVFPSPVEFPTARSLAFWVGEKRRVIAWIE